MEQPTMDETVQTHRGEAAGRWSALPMHRSGPAKKIFSIGIGLLACFCLLEGKEGSFILRGCKNMETALSCREGKS